MYKIIILLLFTICFLLNYVQSGHKNGSLVSLDDYKFGKSFQFYSKYFLDFNSSLDLQLAPEYKNSYLNDNVYLKGDTKEYFYLIKDKEGLAYLSNIEITGKKEEVLIPGLDYYVNSTSSTPIITDTNVDYAPFVKNQTLGYKIKCINKLNKVDYDINRSENDKFEIKKFDAINGLDFALIKMINNKNNTDNDEEPIRDEDNFYKFRLIKIKNDFSMRQIRLEKTLEKENITNFWVLKQNNNFYNNNTDDDTTVNYPILAISTSETIFLYSYSNKNLKLYSKILYRRLIPGGFNFPSSTAKEFNITKIGIWNDLLIVGTKENGLNLFQYKFNRYDYYRGLSSFFGIKDKKIYNFSIKDFVINSNTLYCLIENFGLKIFNLNTNKLLKFEFKHPYLLAFDNSSEKGSKIRSIIIDNTKYNVNEFLLELRIENEKRPLVNKIYSYSRTVDANNFLRDSQFTYIFDNLTRKLFMIKRAINPNSPTLIYKIDLTNKFKNETRKFSIADTSNNTSTYNTDINQILFFEQNSNSRQNNFFVMSKISIGGDKIGCKFDKTGEYIVKISFSNGKESLALADTTSDSDIRNSAIIRTKLIYVNIDDSSVYISVLLGILVGCFLIFIILVVWNICKKKSTEEYPIQATDIKNDNGKEGNTIQTTEKKNIDPNEEISIKPKKTEEMVIDIDERFGNRGFIHN